jgi:hypothetical protein
MSKLMNKKIVSLLLEKSDWPKKNLHTSLASKDDRNTLKELILGNRDYIKVYDKNDLNGSYKEMISIINLIAKDLRGTRLKSFINYLDNHLIPKNFLFLFENEIKALPWESLLVNVYLVEEYKDDMSMSKSVFLDDESFIMVTDILLLNIYSLFPSDIKTRESMFTAIIAHELMHMIISRTGLRDNFSHRYDNIVSQLFNSAKNANQAEEIICDLFAQFVLNNNDLEKEAFKEFFMFLHDGIIKGIIPKSSDDSHPEVMDRVKYLS